jgi:GT2 family glycosyltransferase
VSYVGDAVFSVIVPTRRRPRQLSSCLEALTQLDYPREFEVVVAADGGDDQTRPVVEKFGARLAVRLVEVPRRGPAAARNAGADRARGQYLAFTDDDCAPDSLWLAELERTLETKPDSVVGGRVVNGVEGNLYAETSQLVVDAIYAHYRAGEVGSFFTSNNLAIRAAAFRDVGGFDPSFPYAAGEDRDFGDRCAAHGLELQHAPGAVVRHFHDLTLRSFLRQHFTYGRGAAHFRRARLRRGLGVVTVSPGFYATLLRLPVSRHGVRGASLAALAALSQAVYAAGFAREEVAGRRR